MYRMPNPMWQLAVAPLPPSGHPVSVGQPPSVVAFPTAHPAGSAVPRPRAPAPAPQRRPAAPAPHRPPVPRAPGLAAPTPGPQAGKCAEGYEQWCQDCEDLGGTVEFFGQVCVFSDQIILKPSEPNPMPLAAPQRPAGQSCAEICAQVHWDSPFNEYQQCLNTCGQFDVAAGSPTLPGVSGCAEHCNNAYPDPSDFPEYNECYEECKGCAQYADVTSQYECLLDFSAAHPTAPARPTPVGPGFVRAPTARPAVPRRRRRGKREGFLASLLSGGVRSRSSRVSVGGKSCCGSCAAGGQCEGGCGANCTCGKEGPGAARHPNPGSIQLWPKVVA